MKSRALLVLASAIAFGCAFAVRSEADENCKAARQALASAQHDIAAQVKEDDATVHRFLDDKCNDEYLGVLDRRAERDKVTSPLIKDFIQACQDDPQWGENAQRMQGAMMLFGDPGAEAVKAHEDCQK